MELHPDIVVHSLKVLVDPADGSYTPSLLIISAADSLSGMKEVAAVSVGLQVENAEQYTPLIIRFVCEINFLLIVIGYLGQSSLAAANATTLPLYRSGHQAVSQRRYRLQGPRDPAGRKKRW